MDAVFCVCVCVCVCVEGCGGGWNCVRGVRAGVKLFICSQATESEDRLCISAVVFTYAFT